MLLVFATGSRHCKGVDSSPANRSETSKSAPPCRHSLRRCLAGARGGLPAFVRSTFRRSRPASVRAYPSRSPRCAQREHRERAGGIQAGGALERCVIVAHNHPSGNSEPSADEIRISQTLREAGNPSRFRCSTASSSAGRLYEPGGARGACAVVAKKGGRRLYFFARLREKVN